MRLVAAHPRPTPLDGIIATPSMRKFVPGHAPRQPRERFVTHLIGNVTRA
jgi:hypothetical protein